MTRSGALPSGPAMLVVGHPGHELRVHGWLESARPVVMVLTDGSGNTGVSRLASTAAVVSRAGARPGSVFGRLTDAALYRALLDRDTVLFTGLAGELADAIVRDRIRVVAGDDAEGFNPTHDVCRLLVDTAVRRAEESAGVPIVNVAFDLMDAPDRTAVARPGPVVRVQLDAAALGRKMEAALGYPEMAVEVASARAAWGDEAFRTETFRHVTAGEAWAPADELPYYERYGAERVRAGIYRDVIRYDQHMRPLADALAAHRRPAFP